MLVVFGKRTAGRVYLADGRLVSTLFFHLFFVPVIPLCGITVKNKGLLFDEGVVGPLVGKSVLVGWLRWFALGVAAVGYTMAGEPLLFHFDKEAQLLELGICLIVIGSLLWLVSVFLLGRRPGNLLSGAGLVGGGMIVTALAIGGMFLACDYLKVRDQEKREEQQKEFDKRIREEESLRAPR